ncbi:hypothetical protein A2U01_0025166, partial [Trifolium medium]|nr:hypothetical protein [Trifolium medium]
MTPPNSSALIHGDRRLTTGNTTADMSSGGWRPS